MGEISRRSFLKGAASLAVLGAVGGCADNDKPAHSPQGPTNPSVSYNATGSEGLCNIDTSKMEKITTGVAVIGGGGAGICAAIAAAQNGAKVVLMEKLAMLGGATILSGGKIPATGTDEQLAYGVTDDTVGANARDILRPNNYSVREELVYTVCEKAKDMVEWTREMGVHWSIMDSLYYGQSEYRMHNAEGNGVGMTNAMINTLNSMSEITVNLEFTVEGLTLNDDTVTGCYGKDKDGKAVVIEAGNVVLASSGFGNNDEMLKEYCPETLPAVKIVAAGATGEGIRWGEQLGARLACMGAYQGYAFHNVDNDTTGDQGLANNGGIFINEQGHRFCNEYGGYSELTPHILAQSHNLCYLCFTDTQKEKCANFAKWDEAGIIYKADTIEKLAEVIGVDSVVMTRTVEQYKAGIEKGEDLYNRTKLPDSFEGPYYAIKITGEIRHTQGGIATDVDTHVLRTDGSVIQGLYAAGGCTEGFSSGDGAAYMSGNGLLQAMIFGKIAGIKAAIEKRGEAKAAVWTKSVIDN